MLAVVVDGEIDGLAGMVGTLLVARGCAVRTVPAGQLASVRLTLGRNHASLDGAAVAAVLFRARPQSFFATGFTPGDGSFCSQEVRALWLGLLSLRSVWTVNRPDAEVWHSLGEWSIWRRRLRAAGIPLAALAVGDSGSGGARGVWTPWGGGIAAEPSAPVKRWFATAVLAVGSIHRTVWCCGRPLCGPVSEAVRSAGAMLRDRGVSLAEVVSDDAGAVVGCSTFPEIPQQIVHDAARPLANAIEQALHRR